MKLAILFDRFGPYHVARLRGAMQYAEVIALEGAPHRGVYDWVPPQLPKGLQYRRVTEQGQESVPSSIHASLNAIFADSLPDAIAIPGWSNVVALSALGWAKSNGVTTICMSETNDWDFQRRSLQEWIKRGAIAHYDAGLVTNDSQQRYLVLMGVSEANIRRGYNAIDNDYFRTEARHWRDQEGLPAPLYDLLHPEAKGRFFLTSNRFIEKKNLSRLLAAYADFRSQRPDDIFDWPLVMLGDGELRSALEKQRSALGLDDFVHMQGFLQIEELPKYYGCAGAFVHASTTEQWGLVVNEAMAAGLPVAVSRRCGCAEFLIENGVTGFDFDPFSTEEITKTLHSLAQLPPDSPLLEEAHSKIEMLRPERFGEGLVAAARHGSQRRSEPTWLDDKLLRIATQQLIMLESAT